MRTDISAGSGSIKRIYSDKKGDLVNQKTHFISMFCTHCAILCFFITGLVYADTTYTYTSSTALINNPERGLYYARSMESESNFDNVRPMGSSLCYANITLEPYRSSEISSERLLLSSQ